MVWAPRALLLTSLVLFLAPASALAQSFAAPIEPFSVSVDPAAPHAHGVVTLTPVPGDVDFAGALMTVVMNGTKITSGNPAPVSIRLGPAGEVDTITVSLKTSRGTFKQVVTVVPQDVTLVVEPLSSSPPLYPGKPGVPVAGSARVVAVADLRTAKGVQLDPSTLSYAWEQDGASLVGDSGTGRRTLVVTAPLQYRASTVTVTVTSPDGNTIGSDSVDIIPTEPTVRLYERDPLMGIRFDRALGGTFALSGSEVTLYAGAYSFPTALGPPRLSWYVANALAQTGSLITLRPTGKGVGTASVSLTAASKGSVDAPATSAGLIVSFGSKNSGSVFGL